MLRILYYILAIMAIIYGMWLLGAVMLAIPLFVRLIGYVTIMRLLGII